RRADGRQGIQLVGPRDARCQTRRQRDSDRLLRADRCSELLRPRLIASGSVLRRGFPALLRKISELLRVLLVGAGARDALAQLRLPQQAFVSFPPIEAFRDAAHAPTIAYAMPSQNSGIYL